MTTHIAFQCTRHSKYLEVIPSLSEDVHMLYENVILFYTRDMSIIRFQHPAESLGSNPLQVWRNDCIIRSKKINEIGNWRRKVRCLEVLFSRIWIVRKVFICMTVLLDGLYYSMGLSHAAPMVQASRNMVKNNKTRKIEKIFFTEKNFLELKAFPDWNSHWVHSPQVTIDLYQTI